MKRMKVNYMVVWFSYDNGATATDARVIGQFETEIPAQTFYGAITNTKACGYGYMLIGKAGNTINTDNPLISYEDIENYL